MRTLIQRIDTAQLPLAIIGLGYVGLPLAVEFASAGFHVTGIDVDASRVQRLLDGRSYVGDVPDRVLRPLVKQRRLSATIDYKALADTEAVIICVPTPLRKTRDPDISYIVAATREIIRHAPAGRLFVLESTSYPGTCEEVILPMLEVGGRRVGRDFFLAFSPERVDPGNTQWPTQRIPKIVGGVTKRCAQVAARLYSKAIQKVIPVSSTRVAEMIKLLENTFRSVNIGLINEIALMCHRMGLDVWEVIDGAATKPFAFMPFYPGPGLGGHCLPIDPLYLSWKARLAKFNPKFIELAAEINESMPAHVVERVADLLNERGKPLRGAKILLLGVAYKRNVSDTRESPALEIIDLLRLKGADVAYTDPHVPELIDDRFRLKSLPFRPAALKACDCAIIVTDHRAFDYRLVVRHAPLVFDTRNATKSVRRRAPHVATL